MQRKGDKILLAERQTFSSSRKKYRNEKCVKNIFFLVFSILPYHEAETYYSDFNTSKAGYYHDCS
jgi:hypothetical protein